MSKEFRQLTFGICVQDSDYWTDKDLDRYDGVNYSPEDDLRAAMQEAGNTFIRKHPHLFCGELV